MSNESYVDQTGEWRTKKISLMGVVQSFISQLRPGQDLTRTSLPSILSYPFSLLEVLASRTLGSAEQITNMNYISDPVERMEHVALWMVTALPTEVWRKKPFNPVIGEHHGCFIYSEGRGKTEFLGEQVSHHPPVSAFYIRNEKEQIFVNSSVSFGVRYGTNSLGIPITGGGEINCRRLNETYIIPKLLPNMAVKNLIFGSKKIYWEGDLTVSCPQSGVTAEIHFSRSGDHSAVKGNIFINNQSASSIEGTVGKDLKFKGRVNNAVQIDQLSRPKISYPQDSDSMTSLNVWSHVNRLLMLEKYNEADDAKRRIEEEQRVRIAKEGPVHQANYFEQKGDRWVPKMSAKEVPHDAAKSTFKLNPEPMSLFNS
eukprot:TRINITY_DN11443_c0_g1_i1.p1 TRINITY_DN11443_c0_g1~~TRINITY_DN11443_c0_g1_i1.p1  ORF type:complete len:370 (-),score=81.26 TRINITY_DN11443_c0_g1_i1:97-1206(-)